MARTEKQPDIYHIWTQIRNVPAGGIIQFTDDNGKVQSGVEYFVANFLELEDFGRDKHPVRPPNDSYRWVVSVKDKSAIHTIQKFRKVMWLVDASRVKIDLDIENDG